MAGSSPHGTSTRTIGGVTPGMPGTGIVTGTTKINASGFVPSSPACLLKQGVGHLAIKAPGAGELHTAVQCSVQAGHLFLGCEG